MTAIGLYNSLFHTQAASGGGQSGATAANDAGAEDFIAQLQQAAIDEAAPAAKIKATATALTTGAAPSTPYTALPIAPTAQVTGKTSTATSGVARQLATLTPATGQTSFATQALAQQPAADAATPTVSTNAQTATDKFMQFAKQSPVERLRSQILGGMNMTEQQVAQMSPAQQTKIETAVREKIREATKKDMGVASSSSPATSDILASL